MSPAVGRIARLSVAALLACGCSTAAGPPPSGPALPVGPIGHQERWLTDAEGRVLLVHGVNMVEKNAPYYPSAGGFSDADAAWLATNGLLVVRVGILATGLMPTPGVVDAGYIQQIAATVDDLAKHGVYSLLDFHQDGWGPSVGSDGFPAWMTLTGSAVDDTSATFPLYYQQNPALQQAFQSFWGDAPGPDGTGLEEDYAAMFGAVAKQFAGEPYVLGYDLFNEPWPGNTWAPCLNDADGCPSLDTGELGPAYAKAVAAIRAAGDEHLILGEPFNLFNLGYSTTSIPVPGGDANAGMSFHVYPLLQSETASVISNAIAWSQQTGGALLNTEWGATEDVTILTADTAALDSALVPWILLVVLLRARALAPGRARGEQPRGRVRGGPHPALSARRRRHPAAAHRRPRRGHALVHLVDVAARRGRVRHRHGDQLRGPRAHVSRWLHGHGDRRVGHVRAVRADPHRRGKARGGHGHGLRPARRRLPVGRRSCCAGARALQALRAPAPRSRGVPRGTSVAR